VFLVASVLRRADLIRAFVISIKRYLVKLELFFLLFSRIHRVLIRMQFDSGWISLLGLEGPLLATTSAHVRG
jgi:hypothetical protein